MPRLPSPSGLAGHVAVDLSPLRASRDFRLLVGGEALSTLGTQVALVALPYQVFLISHSATLVGLLGAFELGPMVAVSSFGGVLADRADRRRVLLGAQCGVMVSAGALAVATLTGRPPVLLVLALGGLLAGAGALDGVTRAAIVPNVVDRRRLSSALAFDFGILQVAGIVGPAVGGLVIAASGVGGAYVLDGASCLAMVGAALAMSPQDRHRGEDPARVLPAVREGLGFVRSTNALAGSFAIDLVAMTFGLPRVLFPVLALTVYGAGPTGAGLLYSALAAGSVLAVLTAGWIERTARLGRVVIMAVLGWGGAVAGAGLVRSLGPALALLAVAGFADGVSSVCRSTINQTVTPDSLRGRMSALYVLVVTSGPRLGDVESGLVAGVTSATTAVLSGGLACVAGALVVVKAFPGLLAYDRATATGTSERPRRTGADDR